MMVEIMPGIISDPEVMGGQPILKGHRIAVSQLLGQLAGGMKLSEIQEDYQLTNEEMQTILTYAALAAKEKDVAYVHQS
jgi:uncharacterized protein (DUF433 family)